jgi:hypothetical protein
MRLQVDLAERAPHEDEAQHREHEQRRIGAGLAEDAEVPPRADVDEVAEPASESPEIAAINRPAIDPPATRPVENSMPDETSDSSFSPRRRSETTRIMPPTKIGNVVEIGR